MSEQQNLFKNMQYRMAEVLFRPGRVILRTWKGENNASHGDIWASLLVVVSWIVWGALVASLIGDVHFGNAWAVASWLGAVMILFWGLGFLYSAFIFILLVVVLLLSSIWHGLSRDE
ncbi:hypothetical protein [uncultured Ruegeria sp.]|uniref:hypothetical protein n=1 Tax=uncultured Ruegeria sp. TaxID=259304 RepID=UPI00260174F1|nr:hypothetical protein [uncultured Ruegeria sp.]